jgi:hypothetical protein
VRCVRAGSESDIWSFDFFDNGNGTVTHRPTGLVWQQEDDNTIRTWEAAISYCEGLTFTGHGDWRLPNVRELQTLVDYSRYGPAIDSSLFPGTDSSYYWSSTSGGYFASNAWYVYFLDGYVGNYYKTSSYYVRCVRGGQ